MWAGAPATRTHRGSPEPTKKNKLLTGPLPRGYQGCYRRSNQRAVLDLVEKTALAHERGEGKSYVYSAKGKGSMTKKKLLQLLCIWDGPYPIVRSTGTEVALRARDSGRLGLDAYLVPRDPHSDTLRPSLVTPDWTIVAD